MKTHRPTQYNLHDAVSRMLKHALTLGDFDTWSAFSDFVARLHDRQLASLGFAVLKAQMPEQAELTADAAINGTVHMRPPSFIDTPAGRQAIVEWREARDRRRAR